MNTAALVVHTFFPAKSNNFKGKILQPFGIFVLTFLFLITQIGLEVFTTPYLKVLGYAANISVDEEINLTNQRRAEAGLPALTKNADLERAAKEKGLHMLEHDYWAHVAPDGTEPWFFFSDVGYKYRYAGENLARDFSNAKSAMDAWMASPTHKENILSPKYKDVGIAVVEGDLGGKDTTIIVSLFGTRASENFAGLPVAAAKTNEESSPSSLVANTKPKTEVLPSGQSQGETLIGSKFNLAKTLSFGLAGLLFGAFLVDAFIIAKRRIVRVGGKVVAHVSFLAMVLIVLLIIRAGQIL